MGQYSEEVIFLNLLYIVRHGETQANLECVIQGWSNSALTPYGIALAEATGQSMRGIRFDGCFSSPLGRAVQTAEIILRESGNAVPIVTDGRIKEVFLGEWENKKLEDVKDDMRSYFHDPGHFYGAPNGETLQQVCARTQSLLQEVASGNDGRTYLIVTHGCAYRAMLNGLYGDPSDFWHGRIPPNCAVSVVKAENGHCRLIEDDRLFYDPDAIEGYHDGIL